MDRVNKAVRFIGDVGNIGQGVALILGAIALFVGYARELPWPITLAIVMAAIGTGLIVVSAISSRSGGRAGSSLTQSSRSKAISHVGAPFIAWLYPNAYTREDGAIIVNVYCENAGPRDSEAVVVSYFAESSRPEDKFLIPESPWARILSRKLGDQHRFMVSFESLPPDKPWYGEREISWGMIYFDGSDRTRIYVTKASMKADFQSVGPAKIGEQWMDATSTPEERHERWVSEESPLQQAPR